MKKYLSSLLVLALFLNSFSVFAMKKREEDFEVFQWEQEHPEFDHEELYNDLEYCVPNHLITWKILPFLDVESLGNVSKTNKFFRKRAGEFLNSVDLKALQNGIFSELFGSFLKHEEIRELVTKLESEIRKDRNLFLYKDGNELKIEDLTEKDVKEELFKIFKDREPKLAKVFDNVIKIFSKISNLQQQVFFERTARKALNKIIMLGFK